MYRSITFLRKEILIFIKQCKLRIMPDNTCWSTKVCVKLLSDLVVFSVFSYDIPLDFHQLIPVVPLKYLIFYLIYI